MTGLDWAHTAHPARNLARLERIARPEPLCIHRRPRRVCLVCSQSWDKKIGIAASRWHL